MKFKKQENQQDYKDYKFLTTEEYLEDKQYFPQYSVLDDYQKLLNQYMDNYLEQCFYQANNLYPLSSLIEEQESKPMLQKLTNILKRVLNKEMQVQYKAGYRNGDLELTERGTNALLEILAQDREAELADSAREYIKEVKEEVKEEEK